MNLINLSRIEREDLFVKRVNELNLLLGKPIYSKDDWGIIKLWDDDKLKEEICEVNNQIRFKRFERNASFLWLIIKSVIIILFVMRILGFLLFGIKQWFK